MKSFRFIDTKRFSPVIYENDVPWTEDYFHKKPEEISKEFLEDGNYVIDEDWWRIQRDRCLNGYYVPNAIEEGGDYYTTDRRCITDDKGNRFFYGGNFINSAPNEIYIEDLGITIKDKGVRVGCISI